MDGANIKGGVLSWSGQNSLERSQVCQHMSVTSALRKLRQEGCYKFEVNLGYIVSSKPVGSTKYLMNTKQEIHY